MSRWDMFPYVRSGKELATKPLWVQVLVGLTFAAFWAVTGVVTHSTWLVGVGGICVLMTLIGIARRTRSQ